MRQWVLTVPYPLRARMMFDPALVLRELIAAVSSWLCRRARRLGVRGLLKAGAIAVVQRFNSALNASPHFHTLFLDGVYSFPPGRKPVFHPTPAPRDEDIARVAAAVYRRVARKLSGRESPPAPRRFEEGAQVWCALAGASADSIVATGARRGRYLLRVRELEDLFDELGDLHQLRAGVQKKVLAHDIQQAMKAKKISPSEMARRMRTSREAVYRLLDPTRTGVTLDSLQRAASALGRPALHREVCDGDGGASNWAPR